MPKPGPRQALKTFAEVIEGEAVTSKSVLAQRMEHIAAGQPMYRWVEDGVPKASFEHPGGGQLGVNAVYPTYAEVQKAIEWLGNKLETPQTKIKVKVTGRVERSATDRAMDQLSADQLMRLAGRVVKELAPAEPAAEEDDQ